MYIHMYAVYLYTSFCVRKQEKVSCQRHNETDVCVSVYIFDVCELQLQLSPNDRFICRRLIYSKYGQQSNNTTRQQHHMATTKRSKEE